MQAIQEGWIALMPFDPERVGPASVDLTLGRAVRVFRKVHQVSGRAAAQAGQQSSDH